MSNSHYDDFDVGDEDTVENETIVPEASPSTKLARRRKIEDLFEERRLREELAEFG